jgi:hypothetical protein
MSQPFVSFAAVVLLTGTVGCDRPEARAKRAAGNLPMTASIHILERGPNCGECTFDLEELAVLGAPDDELPVGDGSFLAVVAGARCVVAPTDRDGEVLLFDGCVGAPRQFGRQGEGPGELTGIRTLDRWGEDSIVAFGYGRMEFLSGATGQGRSVRFDPTIQGHTILASSDDGVVIVNSDRHTRPQFMTIHADGSIADSVGLAAGSPDRGDSREHAAVLGEASQPRQFWSGTPFYRYELTRWSVEGRALQSIRRQPDWFAPYDSTALAAFWKATGAAQRPLPAQRAIHESADGVLWVAFGVSADGWQPDSALPAGRRGPRGEQMSRARTRLEHYDGVLEALDAATGELLISIRTDDLLVGFPNDTLAYARRVGEDGINQIAVFRLRFRRGP